MHATLLVPCLVRVPTAAIPTSTSPPGPGDPGRWSLPADYSGLWQLGRMYGDLDTMRTAMVGACRHARMEGKGSAGRDDSHHRRTSTRVF